MADLTTLAEVRAHLRFPTAFVEDDAMLSNIFIPAATEVIQRETVEVLSAQYDEYYNGGQTQIRLRHVPISSVELVEEGWGTANHTLTLQQVNTPFAGNMFAFSIDDQENGLITRRSAGNVVIPFVGGNSNIHVVYSVGLASIPPSIKLAALELVAHWYQNSQQIRSLAGGGDAYDTTNPDYTRTTGTILINQGVPYRIIELLKPYRRPPIIG